MKPQQSKFSKLSKKQLTLICEKLVNEDFPIGNPYSWGFDAAFEILKDISKYFSMDVDSQEDVEFFSKFLEINGDIIADLFANNREQIRNMELIEKLKVPAPRVYVVNYDVDGSCNYTEYLSNTFSSYDEGWVEDMGRVSPGDAALLRAVETGHRWIVLSEAISDEDALTVSEYRNSDQNSNQVTNLKTFVVSVSFTPVSYLDLQRCL